MSDNLREQQAVRQWNRKGGRKKSKSNWPSRVEMSAYILVFERSGGSVKSFVQKLNYCVQNTNPLEANNKTSYSQYSFFYCVPYAHASLRIVPEKSTTSIDIDCSLGSACFLWNLSNRISVSRFSYFKLREFRTIDRYWYLIDTVCLLLNSVHNSPYTLYSLFKRPVTDKNR